jgi:hypothetical protein
MIDKEIEKALDKICSNIFDSCKKYIVIVAIAVGVLGYLIDQEKLQKRKELRMQKAKLEVLK